MKKRTDLSIKISFLFLLQRNIQHRVGYIYVLMENTVVRGQRYCLAASNRECYCSSITLSNARNRQLKKELTDNLDSGLLMKSGNTTYTRSSRVALQQSLS
jgi:hypothetical protein